jgi:diketogulonate reductase-like aldo/keto reductase
MALKISSTIKLLSGNLIPQIGFGTYSLKGQVCEDAAKSAFSAGYRHIDTGSIFKN